MNLTEQQVRQIVQQELAKAKQSSRFNLNVNPRVTHTGIDSAPINSGNIKPGLKTSGSVTMSEEKDYKFNVNFSPTLVFFYGTATNGTDKTLTIGQAALGQNLYFQPINTSSVGVGGKFQIVQSSSSLTATGHAPIGEGHIIDVFYSGTIFVRATVSSYGQNSFTITVDHLESGWEIVGNFFVS